MILIKLAMLSMKITMKIKVDTSNRTIGNEYISLNEECSISKTWQPSWNRNGNNYDNSEGTCDRGLNEGNTSE